MNERISDKLASLIEPFTVGCRAARRGMIPCGQGQYVTGQNALVFGCGTIGIAAAVALKHFGMEKVMLCDHSDFRLKLAEELGFAVCNPAAEDFAARATAYFGTAPSLSGPTADIDCWLDAAGAESILDDFLRLGKIESRFVSVAVNNQPRSIDLLHMTYAQQSIIGFRAAICRKMSISCRESWQAVNGIWSASSPMSFRWLSWSRPSAQRRC